METQPQSTPPTPLSILNEHLSIKNEIPKSIGEIQQKQKQFEDIQQNSIIPAIISLNTDAQNQLQKELKETKQQVLRCFDDFRSEMNGHFASLHSGYKSLQTSFEEFKDQMLDFKEEVLQDHKLFFEEFGQLQNFCDTQREYNEKLVKCNPVI